MTKQKDVMLDHDYDGIRELDNDLPPWWLYMFYITIIWAVGYLFYYHVLGVGDSSYAEYMKEMDPTWTETRTGGESILPSFTSPFAVTGTDLTPRLRVELASARSAASPSEAAGEGGTLLGGLSFDELIQAAMMKADPANLEKLKTAFPEVYAALEAGKAPAGAPEAAPAEAAVAEVEALTDDASIAAGKALFMTNCVTCHGQNGEGGIGPNLTDDYWIHGGGAGNLVHTITNGVPAKGMIAWGRILKPDQVLQAASFILTLHGTNPPNPKAPQGEKWEGK